MTPSRAFPTLSTPSGVLPDDAPHWNRQRPSQMPSNRYRDVYSRVAVPLETPTWPSARLTQAPLWVPVDLRDGNQALAEPMDPSRKRRFFELMVAMGYKEIEVGYPSASRTDYDFVRLLAETDLAPADVTIVVFTPARRELIERTVESVRGIRNPVVIHMYTATAPTWRDVVLGQDREGLIALILAGGEDVLRFAGDLDNVRFEFSPEVFTLTEPDFVLDVCGAMTTLWDATPERPVILNLPATVEVATPNVYADQIEYMHRNLGRRDGVILSVHPHNDRGTGVACAELAVLAGAQRVEGCLFGNGERTGNVDLVTLALNLHAQGVDPMIDFSDIDEIRRTVAHCNGIDIHVRHPYAGDLVHTAFSGTHQDAIRKGFAEHRARAAREGRAERDIEWRVPYLPIDPADIGRSYDAVIRVNSQSGKGGIAYLLEDAYGIELPRRLQIDLARHVQQRTEQTGREVSAAEVWAIFDAAYLASTSPTTLRAEAEVAGGCTTITLHADGVETRTRHDGVGPVEALGTALAGIGLPVEVLSLHQTSIGSGAGSEALTLIEYRDGVRSGWAAGRDRSVLTATLHAVRNAAERSATAPRGERA
ncbi:MULTISPECIES: 2-isopropylmalate synthase [unclassified Microbacterium]|nr:MULTISPECIES: 2-isopropylmalate synthase [unclassified Microbacterium]MCT1364413.1 2-isopropylmalate synthase [Microbacterium sp. p3-SID131]MCT1377420.1 2-isopropylmalate synthase [Microbacterium sp. p3-SID337]MDH5134388.1 2-isopropylmalate synthase [Microbacterium sp. RD10]MDH5136753.1 2-isopropylmalate synthase [Microbacterium sp. RD11]MDH5145685.1 2-isopropylmalate synthase [Microbacterium sp. RD12]